MKGKYLLWGIVDEVWDQVADSARKQHISMRDWIWQAVLAKLSKEEEGNETGT